MLSVVLVIYFKTDNIKQLLNRKGRKIISFSSPSSPFSIIPTNSSSTLILLPLSPAFTLRYFLPYLLTPPLSFVLLFLLHPQDVFLFPLLRLLSSFPPCYSSLLIAVSPPFLLPFFHFCTLSSTVGLLLMSSIHISFLPLF